MKTVQVLGPGCPKCKKLAVDVEAAARKAGIAVTVEKVVDIEKIVAYNVIATPALVVDGVVKAVGRLPSEKEIIAFLTT
jgi:small redox-active disulfide protein 2